MSVGKELLWKAWPKGYLAARGVRTVGGWTCMGLVENEHKFWMRADFWMAPDMISLYGRCRDDGEILGYGNASPLNVSPWTTARKAGDLLPNVDPADRATWACLLQDLAEAAFVRSSEKLNPKRALDFHHWDGCWVVSNGVLVVQKFPNIDTDNPAEALVLARIQLREAEDG